MVCLWSSKALSIKLIIKEFGLYVAWKKLKVAYSKGTQGSSVTIGIYWVLVDPLGELEQIEFEFPAFKADCFSYLLTVWLWIRTNTDQCQREKWIVATY